MCECDATFMCCREFVQVRFGNGEREQVPRHATYLMSDPLPPLLDPGSPL